MSIAEMRPAPTSSRRILASFQRRTWRTSMPWTAGVSRREVALGPSDEVNHCGDRYVVSNVDQTCEVPDYVGHILLRVGAGATRIDTPDARALAAGTRPVAAQALLPPGPRARAEGAAGSRPALSAARARLAAATASGAWAGLASAAFRL
jgi:hypothetical protein